MMLSQSAANGVAVPSSFSRNFPIRSRSGPSFGSRSRRCEIYSSASNQTLAPLVLEERPAMGGPLYASARFPHTGRHEEHEFDREAPRESWNQGGLERSRSGRHAR